MLRSMSMLLRVLQMRKSWTVRQDRQVQLGKTSSIGRAELMGFLKRSQVKFRISPITHNVIHNYYSPQRGGREVYLPTYINTYCYRLWAPPTSQCAHDVLHAPNPTGVRKFRNKTISAAVQPPTIAVNVIYIFSLAADVIARSAPPGIAEWLHRLTIQIIRI